MKIQLYQAQFKINKQEYEEIQAENLTVQELQPQKVFAYLTKDFDVENLPIPHIGESVSDPLWPRDYTEQKVVNVVYDYTDFVCYITLEPFAVLENSQLFNEYEKIATLHDWTYHKFY